ncbi:MAG: DegT/DnrJ/EryC1/StrS family aminotransferase, partial [Candidatus Diapherotrites archaeon]|nr:DegT/DnrJ/EryC1/StrS family aminotransferase [Candidatus Diapherotrites archaeon]
HFLLPDAPKNAREQVRQQLREKQVDSRPLFYPLNALSPYCTNEKFLVTERISARGLGLPSGANLTTADQDRVIDALLAILQ